MATQPVSRPRKTVQFNDDLRLPSAVKTVSIKDNCYAVSSRQTSQAYPVGEFNEIYRPTNPTKSSKTSSISSEQIEAIAKELQMTNLERDQQEIMKRLHRPINVFELGMHFDSDDDTISTDSSQNLLNDLTQLPLYKIPGVIKIAFDDGQIFQALSMISRLDPKDRKALETVGDITQFEDLLYSFLSNPKSEQHKQGVRSWRKMLIADISEIPIPRSKSLLIQQQCLIDKTPLTMDTAMEIKGAGASEWYPISKDALKRRMEHNLTNPVDGKILKPADLRALTSPSKVIRVLRVQALRFI